VLNLLRRRGIDWVSGGRRCVVVVKSPWCWRGRLWWRRKPCQRIVVWFWRRWRHGRTPSSRDQ